MTYKISTKRLHNTQRKNFLVNSSFDVAQRGQGPFNTNTAFTYDRWQILNYNNTGLDSSTNFSVQRFELKHDEIEGNSKYFLRYNNFGGLQDANLRQIIDRNDLFGGHTISISGYFRLNLGGVPLKLLFVKNYGTGGSPQEVYTGTIYPTVEWKRHEVSFDISSNVGKTLNTDSLCYLRIDTPSSLRCQLDFTRLQFEIGDSASDYIEKTYAEEFQECNACYRKTPYKHRVLKISNHNNFNGCDPLVIQHRSMRKIPSITIYDENGNNPGQFAVYSNGVRTLQPISKLNINIESNSTTITINDANIIPNIGDYAEFMLTFDTGS